MVLMESRSSEALASKVSVSMWGATMNSLVLSGSGGEAGFGLR
ncbi:hypothetical protein BSG18_03180 [Pseudomonas ogarae]|nr:hypothetical protein BSG18_03180 [Pseudomonas ogarae]